MILTTFDVITSVQIFPNGHSLSLSLLTISLMAVRDVKMMFMRREKGPFEGNV